MGFASSGQVENSGSGTIAALNGAVTLTIPTQASACMYVTGTWVATLVFEGSVDGANWFTIQATTLPAGASTTTITSNGAFLIGIGGFAAIRIRASLYTSGTATVAWNSDNTPNISSTVQQGNAPWSISGTVTASVGDGTKSSYSAGIITMNLAALATDFFTISGSATKTIRVTEIFVVFTGGGVIATAQLLKRSTANTGGTFTTPTAVPHDSNNASGTAVVRAYTLNPTLLGTLVGVVRAERANSPLLTSTTNPEDISYAFGIRPSQAMVLRGTGETLAFNLNGVTLSSGTATAFVEWTEE